MRSLCLVLSNTILIPHSGIFRGSGMCIPYISKSVHVGQRAALYMRSAAFFTRVILADAAGTARKPTCKFRKPECRIH